MRSKKKSYELRVTSYESKRGFTLLELLIVLTIILIGSSLVGVVLYKSLGDLRLKGSAKELAGSLRYARSQAVSEKRIYIFSLDSEKKSYYISAWIPSESPSPTMNQARPDDRARVQGSPPGGEGWVRRKTFPEGITLISKDRVEIFFYPLGSSTGGEFSLRNEKGSTWTIQIDPLSGRVNLIK